MDYNKFEIAEALEFHTQHSVSMHKGIFILLHKDTGEIMDILNTVEAKAFLKEQESEQCVS